MIPLAMPNPLALLQPVGNPIVSQTVSLVGAGDTANFPAREGYPFVQVVTSEDLQWLYIRDSTPTIRSRLASYGPHRGQPAEYHRMPSIVLAKGFDLQARSSQNTDVTVMWFRGYRAGLEYPEPVGFGMDVLPPNGQSWWDVGPNGGYPPEGRNLCQVWGWEAGATHIEMRLVNPAATIVYANWRASQAWWRPHLGVFFHPPGLRLQAAANVPGMSISAFWIPHA